MHGPDVPVRRRGDTPVAPTSARTKGTAVTGRAPRGAVAGPARCANFYTGKKIASASSPVDPLRTTDHVATAHATRGVEEARQRDTAAASLRERAEASWRFRGTRPAAGRSTSRAWPVRATPRTTSGRLRGHPRRALRRDPPAPEPGGVRRGSEEARPRRSVRPVPARPRGPRERPSPRPGLSTAVEATCRRPPAPRPATSAIAGMAAALPTAGPRSHTTATATDSPAARAATSRSARVRTGGRWVRRPWRARWPRRGTAAPGHRRPTRRTEGQPSRTRPPLDRVS